MPSSGRKKQILIALFLFFCIVGLDQFLKYLVSVNLSFRESIPVIKNILHITFITNTGAAFGVFKDSAMIFGAISITAVVFILSIILKLIKQGRFLTNPLLDFGLILVVSGAMGNLLDRLRLGYVIDFIDVRVWPVFNIADTAITIGTFLLILSFCRKTA
jgi:signal peptidase II